MNQYLQLSWFIHIWSYLYYIKNNHEHGRNKNNFQKHQALYSCNGFNGGYQVTDNQLPSRGFHPLFPAKVCDGPGFQYVYPSKIHIFPSDPFPWLAMTITQINVVWSLPSGISTWLLKITPVEIVSCPSQNRGSFDSYVNVYQRIIPFKYH